MAGFSISSTRLTRVESGMRRTDITAVVRNAAVTTAQKLAPALQRAATNAGASAGMVSDIGVHDGHLSDLVMRQGGNRQDVIVGIDGHSRHAEEAEDLEWGSPTNNPQPWVRAASTSRTKDTITAWSNQMTRDLDKSVGA